jgi:hypothetical protein
MQYRVRSWPIHNDALYSPGANVIEPDYPTTILNKAVATINEKNLLAPLKNPFGQGTITRLEMVIGAMSHSSNHYGQVVEYLRMNGIIPPASQ